MSSSTQTSPDPPPGRAAADSPQTIVLIGHDDLRLVADAWGAPGRPPVLLLHGGGQTRHAWGGTAAALARAGWYAVSLDLRGHGDSAWHPAGDYSLDGFVADLHAVLDHFDAPPVLVGASLGGMTSLLAVGESPRPLASGLVLVDIAARIEARGAVRIIEFMQSRPEGFASLEEAAEAVASYLPHRRPPRDLEGLRKNLRLGPDGRYRWHWDPAFLTGEGRVRPAQQPGRFDAAARALTLPTLLVRGRLSDLLSEEGARDFLAKVPHARFADVSEAGHMVAGDRNDLFTAAVLDFLGDVRADLGD